MGQELMIAKWLAGAQSDLCLREETAGAEVILMGLQVMCLWPMFKLSDALAAEI